MSYVDGYVIAIPKKNLGAYRKMATLASRVWRDHGALEYFETAGDDLKVKFGTPFPKLARCKPGETVLFSWAVFKSRAHRDKANEKIMKDPRLAGWEKKMPFDMKRMSFGGFKVLVQA